MDEKSPIFNLEDCIHLECDDIQIGGQIVTFWILHLQGTTFILDSCEIGDSRFLPDVGNCVAIGLASYPSCENLKICSRTLPSPFEFLA